MEKTYYKLTDLLGQEGLSYNKLWRSVETLKEAHVITTFTGAHGAICLTLDEKRILAKFLKYLDSCNGSQKEAVYVLKLELLEQQVHKLEEENRQLHALVEIKPPWWKQILYLFSPHRRRLWPWVRT